MNYEFRADERFRINKSEHSNQELVNFYRLIEIGFIKLHENNRNFLELSYTEKAMRSIKRS